MTKTTRLNSALLQKIVNKTKKSEKYIREQISKRAARFGISSEAAQIAWARDLDIGTNTIFRQLAPHIQDQVRSTIPYSTRENTQVTKVSSISKSTKDPITAAIDDLIKDTELRNRCGDLLRKRRFHDRVFREATVILENRIKKLSGITERMKPAPLVSKVINPDPSKAILIISSESSEQQGFHNICLGIILLFRDKVHHALDDRITKEDALKFCSFIDVILSILSTAKKHP